jgi:HEAT repeats
MKRRWRLWLCLALVFLVWAGLLYPPFHWRLIGWMRGEAFYQGRPTSYWRQKIQQYQHSTMEERQASHDHWMRKVEEFLGLQSNDLLKHPYTELNNPSAVDNSAAVPVLLQLLQDSDPLIRGTAALEIANYRRPTGPAIPILIDLLEDPDPYVRASAAMSLLDVKEAVPPLLRLLNDEDLGVRGAARRAIWETDPEAAAKAGIVDP